MRGSGTVIVDDMDDATLRFSAIAGCGSETKLFMGLVAAFSASEGIRKDTGVISWIRWPNVVAIDGAAVATTSVSKARGIDKNSVELFFSINIAPDGDPKRTSLYDAVGVRVDTSILLQKVLESLSWMHAGWSNHMHPQILRRVKSMTETVGESVWVSCNGHRALGRAIDIDSSGRLVVLLSDGKQAVLKQAGELFSS